MSSNGVLYIIYYLTSTLFVYYLVYYLISMLDLYLLSGGIIQYLTN